MARKSRDTVSKMLRFEILKRDRFTCQYCGRKSPDVELCVDHVIPAIMDGKTVPTNLAASCVECNLGKLDVPLDQSVIDEVAERIADSGYINMPRERPRLAPFPIEIDQWLTIYIGLCKPASRILYLNLLLLMHDSKRQGYLLDRGGGQISPETICTVYRFTREEFDLGIEELIKYKFLERSSDGLLFSQKMVEQCELGAIRRKAGRKGGKKTQRSKRERREKWLENPI